MKLHVNFLLILLFINNSYAGEVDLQLEVDFPDTSNLEFGQILPFSVTVTNLGPDDAAGESTGFLPNTVFISNIYQDSRGFLELLVAEDISIEQECLFFLITGDPLPPPFPQNPPLNYLIDMPIIPANSSISCYGLVQVLITQERIIPFQVRAHITDTETILDNNSVDVVFKLKPRVIPILSIYTLLGLIAMFLIVGQFYLRKNLKLK
jgi:uncharacterized repeat protein (TIGR01451 family)